MKRSFSTDKAPRADHVLSQAIESDGFIFVAGQVHVTPTNELVEGSTAEKLERIMQNIQAILEAAGANLDDVVKVTIYVTDLGLLPGLNEAYPKYFKQPFPAREAIGITALPLGASIEISAVAHRPS